VHCRPNGVEDPLNTIKIESDIIQSKTAMLGVSRHAVRLLLATA